MNWSAKISGDTLESNLDEKVGTDKKLFPLENEYWVLSVSNQ